MAENVTYGQDIIIESLVKKICDLLQQYTQYGGVRPFGSSLLIIGIDETNHRSPFTFPRSIVPYIVKFYLFQ